MQRILIVDDEASARYGLRRALEGMAQVTEVDSAASARERIAKDEPDLLLLDLVMPDEDGLSLMRWLRENGHEMPVLIVSALDTAKSALEAVRAGAADYITKGFDIDELRARAANLLRLSELDRENRKLRRELVAEGQFGRMIGKSAAMRRIFEMAERVAASDATVLILGESGTGKDLLAQEIHARSSRAMRAFVAVNCAALPENLIESELFGHERGAFTGAMQLRKGKFELAHGGTIFLDEIGDMNSVTQAKVLRAIENRTIERLGGTHMIEVDVRIISATHRDLREEIDAGRFREDLFYRLRVVTLEMPTLRERKDDLPLLTEVFLQQLGERHGRRVRITPEAMQELLRHDWPGNVRELRNVLERTVVMSVGDAITPRELPAEVFQAGGTARMGAANGAAPEFLNELDFREAKRKFEIEFFKRKLERHRWNVSKTAAEAGLHRQSLQDKLRELGIQRPGK